MTAPIYREGISRDYQRAHSRLIMLDFDGTLVPFEKPPSMVVNPPRVDAMLRKLASDQRNEVILISGRTTSDLDALLGDIPIVVGAEHGAYMKGRNGWTRLFSQSSPSIMWSLMALNHLSFQHKNTFVELKNFSMAWHYRAIADELRPTELQDILMNLESLATEEGFVLEHSEFTIELRTPGIDKGTAVSKWLGHREFDFVLALGDSLTDEDLFQLSGPHGYSIRVGQSTLSSARFHLPAQKDVLPFLEALTGVKRVEWGVLNQN